MFKPIHTQRKPRKGAINRALGACCSCAVSEIESLERRTLLSVSPLSSEPQLHSLASASVKLFLDFDGDPARMWQGTSVPTTPAFDQDGDPTTFSSGELAAIQEIWARVAEKYSPFNIDVTTVDPGNRNHLQTAQVVIGGNGSWDTTSEAGVSWVRGFSDSTLSNTAYVFSEDLGNDPHLIGEAASHEAGHLFGLNHQSVWSGTTKVQEYNPGTADEAPVMGDSYFATRGVWWKGTSSVSYLFQQDDMAIISGSTNGFGYRADDYGNNAGSAFSLAPVGGSVSVSGVISQTSDSDWFSFTTTGGSVSFTGAVAQYGPTLDLKLSLYDSTGTLISTSDTASLGETLNASLSSGTYYIVVGSHGNCGDVGQYMLTGNVPWQPPIQVRTPLGPSAQMGAVLVNAVSGATVTVQYADNQPIDPSTFGAGDLQVSAPDGSDVPGTVIDQQSSNADSNWVVTYQFMAPIGGQTLSNGMYSVSLRGDEVTDSLGLSAAPTQLGTFQMNAPVQVATPSTIATVRRKPIRTPLNVLSLLNGQI